MFSKKTCWSKIGSMSIVHFSPYLDHFIYFSPSAGNTAVQADFKHANIVKKNDFLPKVEQNLQERANSVRYLENEDAIPCIQFFNQSFPDTGSRVKTQQARLSAKTG